MHKGPPGAAPITLLEARAGAAAVPGDAHRVGTRARRAGRLAGLDKDPRGPLCAALKNHVAVAPPRVLVAHSGQRRGRGRCGAVCAAPSRRGEPERAGRDKPLPRHSVVDHR
jgi:hypothetical protein